VTSAGSSWRVPPRAILGGRAPASGPHLPGHHAVLNGRVLCVVLLRNVRLSDVAFRKLIEGGRRPHHLDQCSVYRRAYLRSLFVDGTQAPTPAPAPAADHAQRPFGLVNAPWPKDSLYSLAGCHLLVLHSFVSALLPHLSSDDIAPTSFRAVWETLPRILNKASQGDSDPGPHIRESFLAVWAELGNLAGSEPPALPWGSALICGSEPLNSRRA